MSKKSKAADRENSSGQTLESSEIEALFAGADGAYRFARWGRPIVPVVFGVDDATLSVVKGAIEAVVALAGHKMAETDAELGANLMMFFLSDWAELRGVPKLDQLIPGLDPLVDRLIDEQASQYRTFRLDEDGAIKACFTFLNMSSDLADMAATDIALAQAVQALLLWGPGAFAARSPLARAGDTVILRPDIAGLIRASYDPVMPPVAADSSHALRLSARLGEP